MKRFIIQKHDDKYRAEFSGTEHRDSEYKITFTPDEPLNTGDLVTQEFSGGTTVSYRFSGYGVPFKRGHDASLFVEGGKAIAFGYFELVEGKHLSGGIQSVNGVKTEKSE